MLPVQLKCGMQAYDWGGSSDSLVARLWTANTIDDEEPVAKTFAELWMGTHPSCPSLVKGTSVPVNELIGERLPFLFKVLSVRKALSIQSHPDKALAERLHAMDPVHYPDANHKPEMAIALHDGFEALCGFRPAHEIVVEIERRPALRRLIESSFDTFDTRHELVDVLAGLLSAQDEARQKESLRTLFTAVMTADANAVAAAVAAEVVRSSSSSSSEGEGEGDQLIARLNRQYPGGDVGVLAALFMNHVTLRAGEGLFIGANEPHAYLSGDLIECMAASDNVIRAGLTPKFRDVQVLCESLTYEMGTPEILEKGRDGVYAPPPSVPEFCVQHFCLDSYKEVSVESSNHHQIMLVLSGSGTMMHHHALEMGSVWLIPKKCKVVLTSTQSTQSLNVWIARPQD